MNLNRSLLRIAVLAAAFAAAGANAATPAATPAAAPAAQAPFLEPMPPGVVDWPLPTQPSFRPLPPELQERGRQQGRQEPEREFMQPTLDKTLPAFTPRLDRKTTARFQGSSSDVLPGQVRLWAKRFKEYYPNASIEIVPPYSGSLGAKELVNSKVDFAFVSRELKPEDLVDFKKKFGYGPTSIPVSRGSYRHFGFLDAVGFFVHPDNPLSKISYQQIDAAFSSTRHRGGPAITTWGQLGLTGEWADKPVHLVGIAPWNGFEEFIRQRVLSVGDKRGEWAPGVQFKELVFPVARAVAADRYALGYTGIAYIDAPVRMLAVGEQPQGPYYAPTYENVAGDYSLARVTFFNVNKAPGKSIPPVLDEFARFILSREGQQAVLDHAIYMPLRSAQAAESRKLLGP